MLRLHSGICSVAVVASLPSNLLIVSSVFTQFFWRLPPTQCGRLATTLLWMPA